MSTAQESRAVDYGRLLIETECRPRHEAAGARHVAPSEYCLEKARRVLASAKLKQMLFGRSNEAFEFALDVQHLAGELLRLSAEVERLQRNAAEASA